MENIDGHIVEFPFLLFFSKFEMQSFVLLTTSQFVP